MSLGGQPASPRHSSGDLFIDILVTEFPQHNLVRILWPWWLTQLPFQQTLYPLIQWGNLFIRFYGMAPVTPAFKSEVPLASRLLWTVLLVLRIWIYLREVSVLSSSSAGIVTIYPLQQPGALYHCLSLQILTGPLRLCPLTLGHSIASCCQMSRNSDEQLGCRYKYIYWLIADLADNLL